MTNNNTGIGMKKLKMKEKFGKRRIIKSIKSTFVKCTGLGRKKMWIKPVPSGENIHEGKESGTPIWTGNIMTIIGNRFWSKRKCIIEGKLA